MAQLTRLSRLITICQRAAKAIPLISDTDRAETSGTDRADCDGTRFAGPLFGECRNLFVGLSFFLRRGHPLANDFSARLVVFHVRDSLRYLFCNSRAFAPAFLHEILSC